MNELEKLRAENDRLRSLVCVIYDDAKRLYWLEKNMPKLAAQIARNAISTPPLRAAIDKAMLSP